MDWLCNRKQEKVPQSPKGFTLFFFHHCGHKESGEGEVVSMHRWKFIIPFCYHVLIGVRGCA